MAAFARPLRLLALALLLALSEGGSIWGWNDSRTVIAMGIALAGTVAFLREQRLQMLPFLVG